MMLTLHLFYKFCSRLRFSRFSVTSYLIRKANFHFVLSKMWIILFNWSVWFPFHWNSRLLYYEIKFWIVWCGKANFFCKILDYFFLFSSPEVVPICYQYFSLSCFSDKGWLWVVLNFPPAIIVTKTLSIVAEEGWQLAALIVSLLDWR